MASITCYKLCYALGVSDENLSRDFPLEHQIAQEGTAFMPGSAIKMYRSLSAIYFQVMNDYNAHIDLNQFAVRVNAMFSVNVSTPEYNPIKERAGLPLLTYMQKVVMQHNELCRKAYQELEIAIPYDLFSLMTMLPKLDPNTVAKIIFIMSKTSHMYGLHFYGHEILNVALGSMLQNDLSLRDRLTLLAGSRIDSISDRSEMAIRLENHEQDIFISPNQIKDFGRPVFYVGDTDRVDELLKIVALLDLPYAGELQCAEELSNGDICVTGDYTWVAQNIERFPNVKFAVTLPIPSKYYRQWRKRLIPNLLLVRQRELWS